jgi:hypothetical protein
MFENILEQGEGILRLAPNWVPRDFCIPGKRLKLYPQDLYAFGAQRGGIDERWFASTTKADNGPLTGKDEGLSSVVYGDESNPKKVLLKDMVDDLGAELLGEELWSKAHCWPIYAKFFDNKAALPLHLHQTRPFAELVGAQPKPEAYYFPVQVNNYGGDFPYSFFGLEADVKKDHVRHCLEIWKQGDNHILNLSRAFRLELGSGWDVPAGILHAPGSLCTYEPQFASDVSAMFQSLLNEIPVGWSMLVKFVPEEKKHDLDFILSMIDWPANTDPNFKANHFRPALPVRSFEEMENAGYIEKWVTYGNPNFSAKELTVLPGRSITLQDSGPYGMIMLQGHGSLGRWPIETPSCIRFGQLTCDEYFVSAAAARAGVKISNPSLSDPIVMLKHLAQPSRISV